MVYVNGILAKTNLYGYSNFYVELDPYVKYGESNEIKVVSDNAAEENSRWYSGSGIYRSVNLYLGNRIHIPADGVKITTIDAEKETAVVEIDTEIRSLSRKKENVKLAVELLWEGEAVCEDVISVTLFGEETASVKQQITVRNPQSVGSYQDVIWSTYDGYVLAAVRSGDKKGILRVIFEAEGCPEQVIELKVI